MLKSFSVVRLSTQVRAPLLPSIRAQYRASYSTSGPSSSAASSSRTSTPSSTAASSSVDSPSSASISSTTNIDTDASPAASSSADSASTSSCSSSGVDSDAAPSSSADSPPTSSGSSSSSTNGTSSSSSSSSSSSKYPSFNADPHFRPPSPSPRRRSPLSRTLFILGWIPVAAFVTSHLYSLGNITGGSMSPTFNGPYSEASSASSRSDVVLLNRTLKYKHDELRPGDIVTLISPLDPRLLLTKRIIALPGDTVRVWVTGVGAKGRWTRIKVPPGHVWVEGDAAVDIVPGSLERAANSSSTSPPLRNKSRDSREFGPVPMGLITSRIEMIVWPPERFGPPAPRPTVAARPSQFPQSTTTAQDRSTQVNPSLARILDEMASGKERSRAHPEDSVISPFVDWEDPNAQRGEEEVRGKGGNGEDKRKQAWNRSSRGGRLGDDAD